MPNAICNLLLAVLSFLALYWGCRANAFPRRLGLLNTVSHLCNPRLGTDRLLGALLERLREHFCAESALLLLEDTDAAAAEVGAAYVFLRDGETWIQQAKLTAPDAARQDWFGNAVAMSGDTLVIGAVGDDHERGVDAGSAYVFVRDGERWVQQAKLIAPDGGPADGFGMSLDIDGDTIIVGAYGHADRRGAAYVFIREDATWSPQAKLTVDDAPGLLGYSVGISGDTIVVGAPTHRDGLLTFPGSAYVFVRVGSAWVGQATLRPDDSEAFDYFGSALAIDGDTVVVGARSDSHAGSGSGSAYVFVRTGTNWSQQAKLTACDTGRGGMFGYSVPIHGDTVVIAASCHSHAGIWRSGAAYVFARDGTTWTLRTKLVPPNAEAGDGIGSIALSGDSALISSSARTTAAGTKAGSVYPYTRSGGTWRPCPPLTPRDAQAHDRFGHSVAVEGSCALVGASGKDRKVYHLWCGDASSADAAGSAEPISDDLAQRLVVLPENCTVAYRRRSVGRRPSRGGSWAFDDAEEDMRPIDLDQRAPEALSATLDAPSYVTVPVRGPTRTIGRLYLTSRRRAFRRSDAELLRQVLRHVMPTLETIRLVDRFALRPIAEERRRIANELHDTVVQPYMGLHGLLAALHGRLVAGETDGIAEVEQLNDLARRGLADARQCIRELRTGEAALDDLLPSVRRLAARFTEATGLAIQVEGEADADLDERRQAEVFHIITEGLNNVWWDPRAGAVVVRWGRCDAGFYVQIENGYRHGRVFVPFHPRSIAERAEMLGGRLKVKARQDGGAIVRVEFPLPSCAGGRA